MQSTAQQTESEVTVNTEATSSQECGQMAKPQQEHEWLHQLVGEWTCEGEIAGDTPAKWKSTEVVRSLGGMWVICEGNGEMPGGGTALTMTTLGYDSRKERFVGTFVGSMMNSLWIYDGALDAGKTVLTLDAEGPGMSPDVPLAKYQDVVEIHDKDHRTLTSRILGPDGKWQQIMKATYTRTK